VNLLEIREDRRQPGFVSAWWRLSRPARRLFFRVIALRTKRPYVFSGVAAGVSPAVEPGILPGGKTLFQPQPPRKFRVSPKSRAFFPGGGMPPSTACETPAATLNTYNVRGPRQAGGFRAI